MDFSQYYDQYRPEKSGSDEDYFPFNIEPRTDKGTWHDYIKGYYNGIFTYLKKSPVSILEIGLSGGQSMLLWKNWFEQLTFVGIDLGHQCDRFQDENTKVIVGNGYVQETVQKVGDSKFDFIIDDGPHTLETQLFCIENYYQFLKQNGRMIIEDIQSDSDLSALVEKCKELNYNFRVIDLRQNIGRYDDILLEITKL